MKTTTPTLISLLHCSLIYLISAVSLLGADTLLPPTATTSQEGAFIVTTVSRLQGCEFVLKRSTNTSPELKGYWTQDVSVLGHPLIQITNLAALGERTLKIKNDAGYTVMQVDRNDDGIYEMFLVYSSPPQKLVDVMIMTQFGWLRHGVQAEFNAGEAILNPQRQPIQPQQPVQEINSADDKAIRGVWGNMKHAINKPR